MDPPAYRPSLVLLQCLLLELYLKQEERQQDFHWSFMDLIITWMEENMTLIRWLAIVFTSWLDMSVIGPFVCGTHS